MSLRNRLANLFHKPKSEAPADPEQPAGSEDIVTWDSLAAERQDDAKPQITYDDLARLVRFPGSASSETAATADKSETTDATIPEDQTGLIPEAALEIVNGGGSLSDDLAPELSPAEPISPELKAFRNFFKTDMLVKRELIDAAPKPTDDYDEASRMDYVEGAYRTFRDFKHDFLGIARDFGFDEYVKKSTEDFFRRGQQDFALGSYGPGVTQDLYRKAFTDMRPDFIEEVKDSFVGYKIFGGSLSSVIDDASTVNELLHAYHSCIMNSNRVLRGVPALAEKKNRHGYPITLRGDRSALGQQVFNGLPDDLDIGWTDIVSVDDHIMMMVRDRGHALTISSEPDADDPSKIWVNYNIPKICNEEMIKALPGLAGYTQNGARGGFVVSRDDLGSSLADFIAKVPTDSDIPPHNFGQ